MSLRAGRLACAVALLAWTSCASNHETVEPELTPASRLAEPDQGDPFRFVRDDEAAERAARRQRRACDFRVHEVAGGSAIDLTSTELTKAELRNQVARVARAFNQYRDRRGELTALEQGDAQTFHVKRLLELRPEASVVETTQGVRLVLRKPKHADSAELRARMRWHASGLFSDPLLEGLSSAAPSRHCLLLPALLERQLLSQQAATSDAI